MSPVLVRRWAAVAAVMGVLVSAAPGVWAAEDVTVACRLGDDRLVEISGMTYSQRHPGVVWVHNDSGGGPVIYALDVATCDIRATLTVAGIEARDLEAIASGRDERGRPVLWVGDIGDNRNSWPEVRLHRIREPAVLRDRTVTPTTFRFTYADRPHDAEGLLADPASSRVWVVTKQLARGRLYALPEPLSTTTVNVARPVRREGALITDGSVSPDGSRYVLRDYVDAEIFSGLPPGERTGLVYLPIQVQGEAVTWTEDGTALLVASESDRRLLRVPIPTALAPATTSATVGSPSPSAEASNAPTSDSAAPTGAVADAASVPGRAAWLAIALVAIAAGIIALAEVRRRRGPAGP